MLDLRKNPRYPTRAKANIHGIFRGENILKDLSITGCCVECASMAILETGVHYKMTIEPERASHIGSFELLVEKKWVNSDNNLIEIGFFIVASPKGKQFQYYMDYLAYRNSNP